MSQAQEKCSNPFCSNGEGLVLDHIIPKQWIKDLYSKNDIELIIGPYDLNAQFLCINCNSIKSDHFGYFTSPKDYHCYACDHRYFLGKNISRKRKHHMFYSEAFKISEFFVQLARDWTFSKGA